MIGLLTVKVDPTGPPNVHTKSSWFMINEPYPFHSCVKCTRHLRRVQTRNGRKRHPKCLRDNIMNTYGPE